MLCIKWIQIGHTTTKELVAVIKEKGFQSSITELEIEGGELVSTGVGRILVSGPVISMYNAPVSNHSSLDSIHFPNLELLVTGFCNSICISLFMFIYANPHHSLFISMGIFL
jgi:hypothetical protein